MAALSGYRQGHSHRRAAAFAVPVGNLDEVLKTRKVSTEAVIANLSAVDNPSTGLPMQVVLLLGLAVFINYIDRGNLATATPLIKEELRLSNSQMGILLSAFFWSYTPLQLVAGWLAQRLDARYVYAVGLGIWSMATAMTTLASGFVALLILRVLVGVGESVTFPCNAKLLADSAPEHERGRANGLVSAGLGLGPAFGTLVGGLLMAHYGYRAGFLVFGVASLMWLWPWLTATRGTVIRTPHPDGRPVSYSAILRQRAAWGTSLGHFCSNYGLYFVLTWLPLYFVKARGFSVAQISVIAAAVYGVYAASAALTGWASDRWIASGGFVNRVRKSAMVVGMLGAAGSIFMCANANPRGSALLLMMAAFFFGLGSPQIFAIAQTLGGSRAAGQWMGLQNAVGNLAGILAPLLTGVVVDRTGEYFWAFVVVGAVLLIGAVAWGAVIPRVEPVRWPDELAIAEL
jgi:MFS family permease